MVLRGKRIQVPVLIVGAGPCGLLAAILLSRYGVHAHIIDQLPNRNRAGRSESLQPRTLEVLESLGLRTRVEAKGQRVTEYAVYADDEHQHLQRVKIGTDVAVSARYPYSLVIDKGELESILEDELHKLGNRVHMLLRAETLSQDASTSAWKIDAIDFASGTTKVIHCQFLLACDGADSVVRSQLGIQSLAYGATSWAVADVSVKTDFEDARRRCTIQSSRGSYLLTPRRGAIRIRKLISDAEFLSNNRRRTSPLIHGLEKKLASQLTAMISPATIEVRNASWVRKFTVTKHLAQSFSNDSLNVFLLGSAAYVTGPLTRQGTNGGMMDAWNLAWKLALIFEGKANRALLSSYNEERRGLFQKAMQFEQKVEELFALPETLDEDLVAPYESNEASGYTSGCGCRYGPSQLVVEEKRTLLSKALNVLTPGKRLLPAPLIRHVDGNEVDVLELLGANYRFKLILFLGELLKTGLPMVHGVAGYLSAHRTSLLGIEVKQDGSVRHDVDLFVVHSMPHLTVPINDIPQPFPTYAENIIEDPGGKWHAEVGIFVKGGGYCLVRPDGYIALVSNLDDCERVQRYMAALRD